MPQVWGDDAAVFNPDRWFKENGESISYSPFSRFHLQSGENSLIVIEYHSWNAGPRSCLGRALATYEGIAITTVILQRFDVILSDDSRVYEPLAAMNMVRTRSATILWSTDTTKGIYGGVPMRVKRRVSEGET